MGRPQYQRWSSLPDECAIGKASVEYAVQPVRLLHVAVDRVRDLLRRVLAEMMVLSSHRASPPSRPEARRRFATTENAARALKLKVQVLEIRRQEELLGAFQAAREGQAQAINVFGSPFLASLYREIVILAAEYRLPAIY